MRGSACPTRILDYDRDPRAAGATQVNYRPDAAGDGITSFSTALRWATASVAAALAGVGFGIVITIKTLLLGEEVHGYPSLIAIITFLSGVQLITIGLLGEYVGKTYMESATAGLPGARCSAARGIACPDPEPARRRPRLPCANARRGRPGAPGRRIRRHDRRGSACGQLLRPCCWAWRLSAARAVVRHGGHAAGRHLGTSLRRDRTLMAVTGDWVTPCSSGRALFSKPPLAFWAPALSIKLLGLSEFSSAPAGLRRHAGRAGAGPCLRRPPVRRQRRALGRTGVRHHAAAAGQRRRGADRSLPGAGRDAVDDVFPAGATRRPPWWRYGFFVGLAIGLLSKGPLALVLVAAPCCPGRCCRRTRAVARAALDRRHDPDAGAGPALVRDGRDPHARLPPVLHRGRAFPALRRPGLARRSVRHRAQAALWRHLAGLAAGDHALGLAGLWLFLRPGQDAPLRTRLASLARDPLRAYLLLWGLAAPAFFTLSGNIL